MKTKEPISIYHLATGMFSLSFHFWTTIIGLHCKANLIIHKTRPSSLISAASLAIWSENTTVWYHHIKHTICAESLEATINSKSMMRTFPSHQITHILCRIYRSACYKNTELPIQWKIYLWYFLTLIYCSDHSTKGITCPSLSEQQSSQKCFVLKTGELSGCQHYSRGEIKACKNDRVAAILKWLC